ncbi:hypothetical protein RRG08_036374 [Elysia crispata]|uniref:Uncharacterized protein n=1 Tax=Elysia crispata TaxID=231223 RepID=A0AAE0ZLR4_9GAST|nr:hypothetical protein RRG08_036374 [Elysia crispata]
MSGGLSSPSLFTGEIKELRINVPSSRSDHCFRCCLLVKRFATDLTHTEVIRGDRTRESHQQTIGELE